MESINIKDIIPAIQGEVLNVGEAQRFTSIAIDSRKVQEHALFVPIVGEKTDGHLYIGQAVHQGAVAVLTEKTDIEVESGVWLIQVRSTEKALIQICDFYRHCFDLPIVAVTGSSGKTTTKDLIASVLSQKYNTLKTQGNYNSQIGIPLTLFGLQKNHEAAVIEIGMDHLGDIHTTIGAVDPKICVITNIGTAHLEALKTQENILKAKSEIFETMREGDFAVLNGDDPLLNTVTLDQPIIRIGINGESLDYKATDIHKHPEGIQFSVDGESYSFRIPGIHNVYNALVGIAIGKEMGLTRDEIQSGLDQYQPSGSRLLTEKIDEILYIDDSYNANPEAVKAALGVLKQLGNDEGQRIAVLGDMLELGDGSRLYHEQIGRIVPQFADRLITVGKEAAAIADTAGEKLSADRIRRCKDASEAVEMLKQIVKPKDTVLIKGSHGVHLEKVMEIIREKTHGAQ